MYRYRTSFHCRLCLFIFLLPPLDLQLLSAVVPLPLGPKYCQQDHSCPISHLGFQLGFISFVFYPANWELALPEMLLCLTYDCYVYV